MNRYFFLATLVLLISCSKDSDPSGDLNGSYAGTYLQSGEMQDMATVRIVLVGSNFSGESAGSLRSICNGSYQISTDSISFKNLCSTPDNELLLAGKYKMTSVGDSLYFIRNSNGTVSYEDRFNLKKQ